MGLRPSLDGGCFCMTFPIEEKGLGGCVFERGWGDYLPEAPAGKKNQIVQLVKLFK